MNSPILSASMMCVSPWKHTDQVLADLESCGIELLHADVMDGHFVPNLMMGTESLRHLRQACPIPMDIHLMIERPEDKLGWFDIQPGDYVSVHAPSAACPQSDPGSGRQTHCGVESCHAPLHD